jgi:hypothetical protein
MVVLVNEILFMKISSMTVPARATRNLFHFFGARFTVSH